MVSRFFSFFARLSSSVPVRTPGLDADRIKATAGATAEHTNRAAVFEKSVGERIGGLTGVPVAPAADKHPARRPSKLWQ